MRSRGADLAAARHKNLRKAGFCTSHKNTPVFDGGSVCDACKERSAARRLKAKSVGMCPSHPRTPALPGLVSCAACSSNNKNQHYSGRYGLSYQEKQALVDLRGGMCDICGEVADLHVDHCHVTNNIRGLLCPQCNKGLGLFRDNPERLVKAVEYLKKTFGGEGHEA